MISVTKNVLAVSAFVALTGLCASAEDLTIVSTMKFGDKVSTSTQYLSTDRARTATGETDSIVEYAAGRMIQINHKKREYTETTFAEMAAALDKVTADMDKMPAFARKAMGGTVGAITVSKGTATRKIAGYDCTQYTLTMGDDFSFDLWVTPALALPMQAIEAQKAQYAAMGPAGRRFVAMFDEMKKIKGLALATGMSYKMFGKKIDTLIEATEVRRGPIPPDTFAVPAGYKKIDSPFKR
jgi:hypothetical protein